VGGVGESEHGSNRQASAILRWPSEISQVEEKQAVAERAAGLVADGQTIGIGSGSAAYLALWAIGQRVARERLSVRVMTSSYETETAATTLGLALVPFGHAEPNWGIDGADEVDPAGRLLKGRGGALFREKLLWASSRRMYLAVDSTKYVERLGTRFPLPIEVDPGGVRLLVRALERHGAADVALRLATGKDGPVITERGNLIADARFDEIPVGLHAELKALPGVIETGLFEGYSYQAL
jgi:ribose 5-phosphate isomerase A